MRNFREDLLRSQLPLTLHEAASFLWVLSCHIFNFCFFYSSFYIFLSIFHFLFGWSCSQCLPICFFLLIKAKTVWCIIGDHLCRTECFVSALGGPLYMINWLIARPEFVSKNICICLSYTQGKNSRISQIILSFTLYLFLSPLPGVTLSLGSWVCYQENVTEILYKF